MDVIKHFIEAAKTNNLTYELARTAVQKFREDRAAVGDTREEHRAFYQKYYEFAKTCESVGALGGVSGYGGIKDYEKLRIKDICRCVDYHFPYGWK